MNWQKKSDDETDGCASLASTLSNDPSYSLDISIEDLLKEVKPFNEWRQLQKLGFATKMHQLLESLHRYAESLCSGELLPNTPPEPEFEILRAAVGELLLRTESALLV
jgi:hypothetical protein